jgi:hypothetical protein
VLALELAGEEWLTVGLAVDGEQPDGVGIGLHGPGALGLGLRGAPEAPAQNQQVASRPLLSRAFVLVVELRGLEPRTCCLQSSRSTT